LAAAAAGAAAPEGAAVASGVAGAATGLSGAGMDPVSVCPAGAAASVWSAVDFEASLEDPPEQAPPMMARVLKSAT
jgi:hypothetical protein